MRSERLRSAPGSGMRNRSCGRWRYATQMLPEGFKWVPRYEHAKGELALVLDDRRHVAQLMRMVDGVTWIARLIPVPGIHAPVITRQCTSFESGKAGIEAWACKYEAEIRRGGGAED